MADEIPIVPVVQPEIPLQPAPANDTPGEISTPSQNSFGEKIRHAAGAIFEKYKVGRGRPRKDGSPKKSDIPIAGAVDPVPGGSSPVGVVPQPANPGGSFLLRRFVVSVVKGAKGLSRFILKGKAHEAGFDDPFIERTFERAKSTEEDWKNFDESTGLLLAKYNIKTQHDELLCWVTDLGNLFKCELLLLKTFDAEIRRRAAENAQSGK